MLVEFKRAYLNSPLGTRLTVSDQEARDLLEKGIAVPLEAFGRDVPFEERVRRAAEQQTVEAVAKRAMEPALRKKHGLPDFLMSLRARSSMQDFFPDGLVQKAALDSRGGSQGGYLLPAELYDQLMVALPPSIVRPRAMKTKTDKITTQFPCVDSSTVQSAGTQACVGGILLNWTPDSNSAAETAEPVLKMMELRPTNLKGFALWSRPTWEDMSDHGLASSFIALFARALNYYEDFAFLQGDGAGQPQGVIDSGAALSVTRTSGGTVEAADLQALIGKLLPGSITSAVFVAHPTILPKLTAITGWVPNGPLQYAGIPIFVTDAVRTLGTKGDLGLYDFGHYVIADAMPSEALRSGQKRSLSVAISGQASETIFIRNQLALMIQERVDGRPWLDAPITLQDGSTQVSPFVVLN